MIGTLRDFDGSGIGDRYKCMASAVLNNAINNEIDLRGSVECSETLCVFIEFHIERALRLISQED